MTIEIKTTKEIREESEEDIKEEDGATSTT